MGKKVLPKLSIDELKKIYDFDYIREHFYDNNCTLDDLRGDIINCYENNLDITQLSAEGPNTTRVTNWFVKKTQHKATSIRAKMSPARAIMDDDALCQILNRIQSHPHFFSVKETTMEQLKQRGMLEFLDINTDEMEDGPKKESIIQVQQEVRDTINKADLQEVRRALSHIPSFHKVSQFPNHVAQRIYEMYAPKQGGIILDSSAGWGNRMMAAMCSKYHYKYLGTDPNSEMHPNYYGLAELIWDTLYKNNGLTMNKKFPEDFIDIRDQGSEFDIPEWHNMSGYQVLDTPEGTMLENKFTGEHTILPEKLEVKEYSDHGFTHPNPETGKGVCDTGKLNTTGAKLPPIYQTHEPEIFNSGIGDLSFTSPPYFFLECYTEDSQNGDLSTGQSAGKGDNYLRWVKEFMYPTVINHFNFLKPGGYYIYNLKDLPKDNLYLYSDWLSVCLDVGFELVEQPVMVLKARRQFGKKADGSDKIDFNGGTERVAVLRKPLTPDANTFNPQDKELMLHIQQYFLYPIIKACRPEQLESKLPQPVINYLEKKFEGKRYRFMKKKKS